LENRVKTAEALLKKAKSERSPGVQLISKAIHQLNSPFPTPHSDDLTFADIDESFRALSIDNTAAQGFQGKSSGAMLVKAAVDLRNGSKNKKSAHDLAANQIPTSIPDTIKAVSLPTIISLGSLIIFLVPVGVSCLGPAAQLCVPRGRSFGLAHLTIF
jgi:hypothetical protein